MRRAAALLALALWAGCASSGAPAGEASTGDATGAEPAAAELRFRILATRADVPQATVETGHDRLYRWLDENPGVSLATYNALPAAAGGPPPGLDWARAREDADEFLPLLDPPFEMWDFRRADLEGYAITPDRDGTPSIVVRMVEGRREDFARFTGANTDRALAIVIDDVVVSAPVLMERLAGLFAIVVDFGDGGPEAFALSLDLPPLALEGER